MELSRFNISKEILDEVISPGYGTREMGYEKLDDETYYVCAYSRLPYAKGKMVEWWFGTYLYNTQSYKLWSPDHTTFRWNEKKQPGTCVGATHISEENIGGVPTPMEITFYDPAEIFDMEKAKANDISYILVAQICAPDKTTVGMFLHVVRDTYYGCEMRNRFWMNGQTQEGIVASILHSVDEMGNLADMLPGLYMREHQEDYSGIVS